MTRGRGGKRFIVILVGCVVAASAVYALTVTLHPRGPLNARIERQEHKEPLKSGVEVALAPRIPTKQIWGRLDVFEEASASEIEPSADIPRIVVPTIHITAPTSGVSSGIQATPRPIPVVASNGMQATPRPIPVVAEPSDSAGVMARFKAPPKPQVAESTLPEAPDREEIARAMGSIRREVQQCYDRGMVPGQVKLTLLVSGSNGRVIKASVDETSSTATCIRKLARKLRFPRFSREQVTIQYPYSFR